MKQFIHFGEFSYLEPVEIPRGYIKTEQEEAGYGGHCSVSLTRWEKADLTNFSVRIILNMSGNPITFVINNNTISRNGTTSYLPIRLDCFQENRDGKRYTLRIGEPNYTDFMATRLNITFSIVGDRIVEMHDIQLTGIGPLFSPVILMDVTFDVGDKIYENDLELVKKN